MLGCSLPREAWKLRGRIGYLGHEPLLYRDLTGRENLRFQARLHGIKGAAAEARIEELLRAAGMERRADERVAELSAGMRQRLAICRCVLHEPRAAAARRARLQPRRRGARAGPRADRARRATPGSSSPTTPSATCPRPTRCCELGIARAGGGRVTPSRVAFAAILGKDLRSELRTLQSLPAMALFAVTTFVIFRFGLDRTHLSGSLAAGVLWATLLFAAVLGINRLFVAEREEGGFDAIRLAPIDRSVLFAAKVAALLVYLLALELIAVPVFALFFLDSAGGARAAGLGPAAGRPRPRRDRHPDLLDGGQLARPRPAGAAGPAAPGGAADDRRDRRHRAAAGAGRSRLPPLRDLADGPRPIRSDLRLWSATRCSTSSSRTDPPDRPAHHPRACTAKD